jgi:hypothetical protein
MKPNESVTNDDGIRQFVLWALKTLGFSETDRADSSFEVPQQHASFFHGASSVQLVFGGAASSPEESGQTPGEDPDQRPHNDVARVPVDRSFLTWLMDQLSGATDVPYAVPTLPALRVHEISARLFEAYTVDGGTLHLSGCTLEDRPLLWQTWLASLHGPAGSHASESRRFGVGGGYVSDADAFIATTQSGGRPGLVRRSATTSGNERRCDTG